MPTSTFPRTWPKTRLLADVTGCCPQEFFLKILARKRIPAGLACPRRAFQAAQAPDVSRVGAAGMYFQSPAAHATGGLPFVRHVRNSLPHECLALPRSPGDARARSSLPEPDACGRVPHSPCTDRLPGTHGTSLRRGRISKTCSPALPELGCGSPAELTKRHRPQNTFRSAPYRRARPQS